MKKIIYVFVVLFVLSGVSFAQNSGQTSKTVNLTAVSNVHIWNRSGSNVKALFLNNDRSVSYREYDGRGDEKLARSGKYYIDKNNVIHITWSNGYEERATLTYDPNTRRAIVEYNGYTLYEEYDI